MLTLVYINKIKTCGVGPMCISSGSFNENNTETDYLCI